MSSTGEVSAREAKKNFSYENFRNAVRDDARELKREWRGFWGTRKNKSRPSAKRSASKERRTPSR